MDFERAVSILSKRIGLRRNEKRNNDKLKKIGLDSREVVLLLLLMQKLMILQVTALGPE